MTSSHAIHVANFFAPSVSTHRVPSEELPLIVREFIARYIRSVEQLEILLLVSLPAGGPWTIRKVYDSILSTEHSVAGWLEELARHALILRESDPPIYAPCQDPAVVEQIAAIRLAYKMAPVRVIEAIYKRETDAAQSFADAFKLKAPPTP